MGTAVIAPSDIPGAEVSALAQVLQVLLYASVNTSTVLATQCKEAIADLPEDSQPYTYDGLIDVARFCVEEEPGWDVDQQAELIQNFPRVSGGERLVLLYEQFEKRFPGLHYVVAPERGSAQAIDELDGILRRFTSAEFYSKGSQEWNSELERNLDALWEISLDRATSLEDAKLDYTSLLQDAFKRPIDRTPMSSASSDSKDAHSVLNPADELPLRAGESDEDTTATGQPTLAGSSSSDGPAADDALQPFLSLASFRALAVASPTLQSFFDHDFADSIRLEPVQRSSTGGAFAWHAAPAAPRGTPRAVAGDTSKSSNGTTSLASALMYGNTATLDAETPASYSRDITSGTRGRVVGFLGGLLGEEGKTRMDALADQVALRLQTHSVKGPLSSFQPKPEPSTPEKPKTSWNNALFRGASAAAGVVTGEAGMRPSLGGRLAGALRRQPSRSADDAQPTSHKSSETPHETPLMQDDELLSNQNPEAALASLRAANEALIQERNTFVIDEVQSSANPDEVEEDDNDIMNQVESGIEPIDDHDRPSSALTTAEPGSHLA
ncbi:hypothetical protein MYAM1_000467 [Malassezia yamatoensis]|uniref:Oxo-4-hydroxy-4-carboxy-5-ureidoimidazoline decarboxylase domain-containing protein n=1 Tax=Malassezia yamatoensis TaxID=253288 RepID=A0AAJ5YR75_9BASI|nr:hypothetical protein MYAM1_000467 [Malassezia yamatoensis]